MTESEQRASVIAEAMSWIGTPFRDQSDVKGAGVDCAMLLVRCFVDTSVVPPSTQGPTRRNGTCIIVRKSFSRSSRLWASKSAAGPSRATSLSTNSAVASATAA